MTSSLEQGSNDQPVRKDYYVTPVENSRLEALQTLYTDAKARADKAATEFEEIKSGIKAELQALQLPQGVETVVLQGGPGRPGLAMKWKTAFRFSSKKLKAADPATYVKYGETSGYWQLESL
jgi:hypothetical protein